MLIPLLANGDRGALRFLEKDRVSGKSVRFAVDRRGDAKRSEPGCRTADQTVGVCRISDLARAGGLISGFTPNGNHVISVRQFFRLFPCRGH